MHRSTTASRPSTPTPSLTDSKGAHEMNARLGRRHGRRATRFLSAICAVGLVAMIVAAGSALAAPATNSQVVPVKSNEASLGGFQLDAPIVIPDPLPIVITDLTI